MEDENLEEETYSLILTSLKHPFRRKILRMLSDRPFSFSEILESLAIDSGHLNYHLKSLGDLVVHTQDGGYCLSTAGWAAVKLMGKVEEQEETAKTNKRNGRTGKTAIVFSAIFAACLLVASIYALAYVAQGDLVLFIPPVNSGFPKMINIKASDQYNYSISFNALDSATDVTFFSYGQNETVINVATPNNSITHWTKYYSNTSLWLASRETAQSVDVVLYDPNNRLVPQFRTDKLLLGVRNVMQGFELSDFGTYRLQFKNLGDSDVLATFIPFVGYINYSKPLFNYGVLGLSILFLYPILFFLSWKWKGKRPSPTILTKT